MPSLYSGPKLPAELLKQVDSCPKSHSVKRAGKFVPKTRKDRRKQDRQEKKNGKHTDSHAPSFTTRHVHHENSEDHTDELDESGSPPEKSIKQPRSILKSTKHTPQDSGRSVPAALKASSTSPKNVREKRTADDNEIAALEKKLGLKGKKISASFGDGLGELLEGLDGSDDSGSELGSKRKFEKDDTWLEAKRRKIKATRMPMISDDEDGDLDSSDWEESNDIGGTDLSDLGHSGDESSGNLPSQQRSDGEEEEVAGKIPKRKRENPYVAPRTSDSQPARKYIPPSLRVATGDEAELAERLRRQFQGQLNKLSETNLISILLEVEKMYQNNPRQYVTSTLIDLLLNLICDRTALNDTFIILHAGFFAAIYKTLGQDFGAQMIERIVERFDQFYDSGKTDIESNKEVVNLVSLLSQLYNLHVIACDLIFDLIRSFLTSLTEAHTELLLRIVRSCGSALRHDDRSSLKDIVLLLQKTVAQTPEDSISARTRFMIDNIDDLKNNRIKAGLASSEITADHVARMRKTLGSLNNRPSLKGTEPLRIGLADIRDTDKKGKWWLVGASWKVAAAGKSREPTDQPTSLVDDKQHNTSHDANNGDPEFSANLTQVARQNGMTTPIRRAIFITLLTSADYTDAHTRLLKLNLNRTQELEIPRVLLHCASREEVYNPYYGLVARELCHGNKKIGKAFGFAALGLFRRMGAVELRGEEEEESVTGEDRDVHIAAVVQWGKLYAKLISAGDVGIGILKALDFRYPPPKLHVFLEVLLVTIVTSFPTKRGDVSTPSAQDRMRAIFSPASGCPGLVFGLRHFFKNVLANTDLVRGEKHRKRLKESVDILIEGNMLA